MAGATSPRAVTKNVAFHQWLTSGVSAMRTLPTICVHSCKVSQVSLHAASGRSGHIRSSLMGGGRARVKGSAECGTEPTSAATAKSGPKRLRLGKRAVGALRVLEHVSDARFFAAGKTAGRERFLGAHRPLPAAG